MNFIEKEKLIKADIVSIENRVRHAFNQGYDLGFKDGKKAKPQDIDYKAQYERLSQKAEIVISQLRADRDRLMSLISVTPQETRWIPVSERLPENHKDVLVYLSSDRISICRYNSHKLPVSNNPIGWGYVPGIGFIDFEKEHVIAWMPLPKAYREVEE